MTPTAADSGLRLRQSTDQVSVSLGVKRAVCVKLSRFILRSRFLFVVMDSLHRVFSSLSCSFVLDQSFGQTLFQSLGVFSSFVDLSEQSDGTRFLSARSVSCLRGVFMFMDPPPPPMSSGMLLDVCTFTQKCARDSEDHVDSVTLM